MNAYRHLVQVTPLASFHRLLNTLLLLASEESDLREARILSGDEHVLDEGVRGARMVHVASQVACLLRIHDVGLRVAVAVEIA